MKSKLILVFLVLASWLLVVVGWAGLYLSTHEVFKSCQPAEINYHSYDPYCFRILKRRQLFRTDYSILVSKKAEPNYGFYMPFPATFYEGLEKTRVAWHPEGLRVTTLLEVVVEIPSDLFTGGR